MKSADIPTSTYWRYLKTNAALRLSTRKLLTKSSGEANAAGAAEPNEETVEQEAHRLKCELARQLSQIKNLQRQTAVCRTLLGSLELEGTHKRQAIIIKERHHPLEPERDAELALKWIVPAELIQYQ